MTSPEAGLSAQAKLGFILASETVWALGEAAPGRDPGSAGRPRDFPEWTWYLFSAAISAYLTARKAAAELASAWPEVVDASKARYPDHPDLWAPPISPSRHHWQYAKKRLGLEPVLSDAISVFEAVSAMQAIEMGIANPDVGSISEPDPVNCLTGDGKVITPLYKANRNSKIVDRETGEILGTKKADPTAKVHIEGGGHAAYGNKVVMISGRTPDWHGRMILSLASVEKPGEEAKVAVECLERIIFRLPGAQAFLYDGALRGVHIQRLLRDLGLIPVAPPSAAKAATADEPRQEKLTFIEYYRTAAGQTVSLYANGGQLGIGDYDADGNEGFSPLAAVAIKKRRNRDGTYRWYGAYRLPEHLGGDEILVRADTTDDDRARKVNRSENFRLVPPGSPVYKKLYPGRSDSEANNRQLEDTLWINRAHSNGAPAQLLDLLGYAILYNSVAIGLARSRASDAGGSIAA